MVCVFCIAVFALVAGSIVASALDSIEEALGSVARDGKVDRTADTSSVAVFDLQADAGGRTTRVTVTLYKEHGRVRIQVHSHALSSEAIRELCERIAKAIGADVVEISEPDDLDDHEHVKEQSDVEESDVEESDVAESDVEPERQRTAERRPPPPGPR